MKGKLQRRIFSVVGNAFDMRNVILFLVLSSFVACNRLQNKVDAEVNEKLTEIFHENDPRLWGKVENVFFNRLSALGLFEKEKDTLDVFIDFIKYVQDQGYPEHFYLDYGDPHTVQLIDELKEIGYVEEDESAQKFLHNICKPIIESYNYTNTHDVIYNYGSYDPDSVKLSYDLSVLVTPTGFGRPNLKRKGLYKVQILFYFSRMIRSDKGRQLHNPQH
ncbi:hypothetical protein [Chryseolinea sp. H1M3-3]|uniref:hypothetical protein n=1 Tax=Chryseolinea sp. H1M3-3 TaxID=3034144 RepID=UPI0023EB6352|nr:hypothetical protein [Chryseolinea sp. H1M3-3]